MASVLTKLNKLVLCDTTWMEVSPSWRDSALQEGGGGGGEVIELKLEHAYE